MLDALALTEAKKNVVDDNNNNNDNDIYSVRALNLVILDIYSVRAPPNVL